MLDAGNDMVKWSTSIFYSFDSSK